MPEPGFVDLRSDTVTTPTEAMRRAMADAPVGDDCYGEDPTVNRLQEVAAGMLGMEAALFVPTGTMANQVALRVLSKPGSEVICEADCHLIHHESGASALLSQVQLRGLAGHLGVLAAADVHASVRPDDPFQPDTSLVAIENTHNGAGGTVWSVGAVRSVADVARGHRLPVFMDGARLFNACVATGTTAADYAAPCDVVTLSLYKCLAAPMGSLVCGTRESIERAWLARRIFGGALRQGGIVAAAGIVALETMVERIAEDHANARALADGLHAVAGDAVPMERVQTNMVLLDMRKAGVAEGPFLDGLRAEGVLAGLIAPGVVRFVTHKDVDRAGVDHAITVIATTLRAVSNMTV